MKTLIGVLMKILTSAKSGGHIKKQYGGTDKIIKGKVNTYLAENLNVVSIEVDKKLNSLTAKNQNLADMLNEVFDLLRQNLRGFDSDKVGWKTDKKIKYWVSDDPKIAEEKMRRRRK